MSDHDLADLDGHHLLPRVLHDVVEVDSRTELLGREVSSPIVPVHRTDAAGASGRGLVVVDADAWQAASAAGERSSAEATVALLPPLRMGELMRNVRELAAVHVAGLALDLTRLAHTAPFGDVPWQPRHRDDLAELRAAAGAPLWLVGVGSAADAEVAAEAGLEGIVVHSGAASHLGGPSTVAILPEILDAVAGMIGVYAGGPVRTGIDVFRYLALGAEAVLVESDRPPANLEAELHYAMRHTGCAALSEIGYESLFAPLFREL